MSSAQLLTTNTETKFLKSVDDPNRYFLYVNKKASYLQNCKPICCSKQSKNSDSFLQLFMLNISTDTRFLLWVTIQNSRDILQLDMLGNLLVLNVYVLFLVHKKTHF